MIPELDRYAWVALLCCCFSLCTTRPIHTGEKSQSPGQKADTASDRITLLFDRIKAAEVAGESLSTAISKAEKKMPEKVSMRSEREIWTGPYKDSTGGAPFNFEIILHQNKKNNEQKK